MPPFPSQTVTTATITPAKFARGVRSPATICLKCGNPFSNQHPRVAGTPYCPVCLPSPTRIGTLPSGTQFEQDSKGYYAHFHTLRHWKATMLYHQTKDVIYVMRFLGHKNIKNTLLYIQLVEVLFKEVNDQYTVKVANNVKEAAELIEVGFEYVTEMEGLKLFRKRK
jgi:hypothetical protein